MDSIKSTSLSKRCGYGADSVEWISELPDSILGHILSFLPTKNAVATHVLSKRWNFVWTTVTNLDFRYPDHCNEDHEYDFVDFVNYVLLLHKPAFLNRLSLTLETESVPSINVQARINSWICAAFSMNVCELFVSVKNFKLPIQTQRNMFGCETLQSLELKCNFCISSEITFSLPRLESLKLSSINFQGEEAFCKLLGGCPVLKYLFMDFYMDNFSTFVFKGIISSTSLRHLELYVRNKCPTRRGAICFIKINAPSLEYVKLEDQVSLVYIWPRLNSLVEANIRLLASLDTLNRINFVVEAFQAFNCAKALTLSAQVIRALSCATNKMTTKFKRLTRLEVTINRNHWSSLQDFIKLSDSLEVLTIKKDRDTSENYLNNSNWEQLDLVPRCLSNSLKTVSIDICDYDHHSELAMVHYILKHGSVLQVMRICFDESTSDFKTKFEMVKKISKFSKKSHVCKVEFC